MSALFELIDCDVHLPAPSPKTLLQYLPAHWSEYFKTGTFGGSAALLNSIYPPGAPSTMSAAVRTAAGVIRKTSLGLTGETAESTTAVAHRTDEAAGYLAALREAVFDASGASVAIASCYTALEGVRHPYLSSDLAAGINEWTADCIELDARLRGSIIVSPLFPEAAVKEIRRVAADSRFVQVLLPVRSMEPYGSQRYWPIIAAAAEHELVVALHFGGLVGTPPTSSGWPSHYIEEYVGMAEIFQTQVTSLIVGGLFDEYADLRVALCEGGFSWLPTLMWQLDKRWKGLRRDVPWVRREPSSYVRERMRATIQPADAPPSPEQLRHVVELIGSDEFLMYASDFPHVHATAPERVLELLEPEHRANVMAGTARRFYPRLMR